MASTASIAPYLPYLRRYARALTGSQESGDAYVRASLEALLAGEEQLVPHSDPRVALYRLFHTIWISSTSDSAAPVASDGPDGWLQTLARSNREALLLTAAEGFTRSKPRAFSISANTKFERDIVEAQASLDAQLATRVLIIEDEPIIAMDLENLMVEMGHEVLGLAATCEAAIKLAHQTKPGLILADVRLADGSSGIEAVSEILQAFDIPGDLHHRLSRAFVDRRTAGADLPGHQAILASHREGDGQPGIVLPRRQIVGPRHPRSRPCAARSPRSLTRVFERLPLCFRRQSLCGEFEGHLSLIVPAST